MSSAHTIRHMRKLRKWLDKNNVTQSDLARRIGVTPGAISHWVNGSYLPAIDSLLALSRETGLSLNELTQDRLKDERES